MRPHYKINPYDDWVHIIITIIILIIIMTYY